MSLKKGREGLSAEQALRAGLAKQIFDVSYEQFAFHSEDSLHFHYCASSASHAAFAALKVTTRASAGGFAHDTVPALQ